jgi:flagellin
MGIVINNNPTALNAWRNLSASNSKLSKSLEKLSSGLQINKGADNPAGLVISEKLRAQATGLEQATKNAGDAISVIQVAEGALQEVHSVLNSIRALAVHAANEGANDADSISADQSQVDNAIDAISRIANTTKFLGKFLLNGGAGNSATISNTDDVSAVSLSTVLTSGALNYNITTKAVKADVTHGDSAVWSTTATQTANDTLTINGTSVQLSAADTQTGALSKINAVSADTGVTASTVAEQVVFTAVEFGTAEKGHINVNWGVSSSLGMSTSYSGGTYTVGTDMAGTIQGKTATGAGLTLTSTDSTWTGTAVTFTTTGNATGTNSTDVTISKSQLKFNIGANAVADEIVSFAINDMRADKLGSITSGFLDDSTTGIKSSQGNSLTSNAAGAVAIIDDAIADVSNERAKLGAYQKNSIESMQNNLGATLENIQSAESRIRDLDMAKEMMNFTRNQILIQAGTSMLAQANQIPQAALQLLG